VAIIGNLLQNARKEDERGEIGMDGVEREETGKGGEWN